MELLGTGWNGMDGWVEMVAVGVMWGRGGKVMGV